MNTRREKRRTIPLRDRIRSDVWTARYRMANRFNDLRALLAGYCNDCPWDVPGEGGGYSHWRCALRRNHDGQHRYRNYVWGADNRTDYQPVRHFPDQPWDRHASLTRRQSRRLDRWHDERAAEYRRAVRP